MSEERKGFFSRLREGLTKTRNNIVRGIDSVFSGFSSIDEEFYEELEEILIMGDIGINATTEIVERLKKQVKNFLVWSSTKLHSIRHMNTRLEKR